jgi:hypothetical protein
MNYCKELLEPYADFAADNARAGITEASAIQESTKRAEAHDMLEALAETIKENPPPWESKFAGI